MCTVSGELRGHTVVHTLQLKTFLLQVQQLWDGQIYLRASVLYQPCSQAPGLVASNVQTGRNQHLESGEQDWIHHTLWWLPFACPQSMLQPVLAGSAPNHSAHWNRTQTNKVKQEFGNIFSQYSFPPYSSLSLSSCMSSSNSFCCFSITKLSVVCNRCIHWMSYNHTNVSEIAWPVSDYTWRYVDA